jgi:hypothetical protein
MKTSTPLVLILAHYDLSNDAKTDLAAVKRFLVRRNVDLYDAALITTDAWDQAHVDKWPTPIQGTSGFLRTGLAALHGGPAVVGPAARRGLPRRDLEQIATSLNPDASTLVVAAQTGFPGELTACFAHASRTIVRAVATGPDADGPRLQSALEELLAAA